MKIQCDNCGSFVENFNSTGTYVCAHCGTKYTYSVNGSFCPVKKLTRSEYNRYLKAIAKRLSKDENTPADILDFQIVDSFKMESNGATEYHFVYRYLETKYFIIFDDLGIKKIEFPKDKSVFRKQQKKQQDIFSMLYLCNGSFRYFRQSYRCWN